MKAEILLVSGMHKLHWYAAPLPSLLVPQKFCLDGEVILGWYFFSETTVWDQAYIRLSFGLLK